MTALEPMTPRRLPIDQSRKKPDRRQLVLLLVLILIGWGISQALQRTAPIGRNVGDEEVVRTLLRDRTSPSREVKDPTLTLVVFTDYQCPACRLAYSAMDAAVTADSHVRVVYRDWPILGPRSIHAARIAIAADRQGIYPALHGRLMNERRQLDDDVLRRAVEESGGDWARLNLDLRVHAADIERQLNLNRGAAFSLGIAGTPAYLAGPILISGATSEAGFAKAFAAARKAATL